MSGELGSLSGYIRGTIYEVLEEQNALINTFDWRVEDADFQAETADVLLKTTLKAYGAELILVHDDGDIGKCIEECLATAIRMSEEDENDN